MYCSACIVFFSIIIVNFILLIAGFASLDSVCRQDSVSIIEDKGGFDCIITATHELGHRLVQTQHTLHIQSTNLMTLNKVLFEILCSTVDFLARNYFQKNVVSVI